jgi:hypothetical protein
MFVMIFLGLHFAVGLENLDTIVPFLIFGLAANAGISFIVAFFWQTKVIFALGDQVNAKYAFASFIAGELLPDLHRKWLRAIVYVAISFAALFLVGGFLQYAAPESLRWIPR